MDCCICGTAKFSKEYKEVEGYSLAQCKNCKLVYLDTDVVPETFLDTARQNLRRENKKIEYWGFPEIYNEYTSIFKKFFKERLSRCRNHHPDARSLFDIGAGYGFWMNFCKSHGIEVKGIDIAEDAVNHARETLKLDVAHSSLAEYHFERSYDIYTLCDVLEHITNPNHELQIIHRAMNPGSLLYIQVPNVLGMRIPYGHNLGLPHHIWQFSFKTLKTLLNKNGLRIIKRYYGVQGVIGHYIREEVNILRRLEWLAARKLYLGNRLVVLCKRSP